MIRAILMWLVLFTCAITLLGWAAVGEWTRVQLYGGDIPGVAVNPTDPSITYAVACGDWYSGSAQFFRSTDGGDIWESRSEGISQAFGFFLNCMAVDPVVPGTIYIGGMHRYTGIGDIYKTTNEGELWVGTSLTGYIRGIAVDPTDSQKVYLATDGGVYRSTDAGDKWELTTLTLICRSVAVERSGQVVWAGTAEDGIHMSTDGGASWSFQGLEGRCVWCVLPDESGPIYAGTDEGVFRRDLSGWENVLPYETRALAGDEENMIYAGTDGAGVYRGTEFSWVPCNSGLTNSTIKALAVDPGNPQSVYAGGCPSGVYRSADGGDWWDHSSRGLRPARIWRIAPHPTIAGALMAATDRGVYRSTDGGASWGPASYGLGELGASGVSFNRADPAVAYVQCNGSSLVYRTTDGGETWSPRNDGINMEISTRICIDPVDPQTLYVGGIRNWFWACIYKSTDAGDYWFRSDNGLPSGSELGAVRSLAIDPYCPLFLYAGCEWVDMGWSEYRLYRSMDAGSSWSGTSLAERASEIRIDPYLPALVHVWDPDGKTFWRSTNGGGTWTGLPWNLSTDPERLGLDSSSFDRLLTSTWTGDTTRVYWSIIDGRWWPLGPPLPFGQGTVNAASAIAIDPHGLNVYVGAYSSGIFSYSKPLSLALVPDEPPPLQVSAGDEIGLTLTMRNLTQEGVELLLVVAAYGAQEREILRTTRTVLLPAETTIERHGCITVPAGTPPSAYLLRMGLTDCDLEEVHDAAGIGFRVIDGR